MPSSQSSYASPLHTSGSSSLRLSHTLLCLSCTYEQFLVPGDHLGLGQSTGNKWIATPDTGNKNLSHALKNRLIQTGVNRVQRNHALTNDRHHQCTHSQNVSYNNWEQIRWHMLLEGNPDRGYMVKINLKT